MTAFVILHHTAITYGAPGGWFYNELKPSGTVSSLLLTLFVATNQAYFMGFFFLLAGYFTPPSLERKGLCTISGRQVPAAGLAAAGIHVYSRPAHGGAGYGGRGQRFLVDTCLSLESTP